MNKTVTVNISGAIFNIEEEAYNMLLNYIESIKKAFQGTEGADEIVNDIESRIAELFQEKLDDKKQVITVKDVQDVMAVMGAPEDYTEAAEENTGEEDKENRSRNTNRKIFRDPDDNLLGGVCSGISHYFALDPLWIRLAFVLTTLAWGGGAVAYVILWIIIPEASTTAEKLQMKGEDVNIDNIKRSVNENADKVKEGFRNMAEDFKKSSKPASASLKNFLEELFSGLGNVIAAIGKVLIRIIGVLFIIFSALSLVAIIVGLIATDTAIFNGSELSWSEMSDLLFLGEAHMTLVLVSALLLIAIPLISIFYAGARMVGAIKQSAKGLNLSLLALFVVGIILAAIVGVQMGQEFSRDHESSERVILQTERDTLFVNVMKDDVFHTDLKTWQTEFFDLVKMEEENVFYGDPVHLYIRETTSENFEVEVFKNAHGESQQKAIERLERIDYTWSVDDSTSAIDLAPYFSAPRADHFRGQEVEIVVRVPIGKFIAFNDNVERIYSRRNRAGRTFLMGPDELELLN